MSHACNSSFSGHSRRTLDLLLAALLVGGALAASRPAAAGGYIVDQNHDPEIFGEWSIRLLGPTGQEFVPQRSWLNVVELWISHGFVFTEPPADVFVRLREATIDGAVLGTSAAVTLFDGHFAPVQFDFATPVELTPGHTYVIEAAVVDAPGSGNPLIGGGDNPTYAPGRAVLNGNPSEANDLWFRTGATPDVAGSDDSWGAIKALYR